MPKKTLKTEITASRPRTKSPSSSAPKKAATANRLAQPSKPLAGGETVVIGGTQVTNGAPPSENGNGSSLKRRVLIVDDHPIVRQGLVQLINQESGLMACGEAENAHAALDIIGSTKPDIAVIDISLKSMNGIELLKNLKIQYPKLPVLVLSMHDESLFAERALRAGAKGYIMKQEPPEKLVGAIHKVLGGEIYVSDKMGVKMLHQFVDGRPDGGGSSLERLSDRELEVFQLIGKGMGTRQIAETLHLSVKTIESYREHIKRKMHLSSGSELVQHAVQWVKNEHCL